MHWEDADHHVATISRNKTFLRALPKSGDIGYVAAETTRSQFLPILLLVTHLGCRNGVDDVRHSDGPQVSITGRVLDEHQPLAAARVRVKGESRFVTSNEDATFQLRAKRKKRIVVTAWKEGYFIAGREFQGEPLEIRLHKMPTEDYTNYAWIDPIPDSNAEFNCGNCHLEIYDEWWESGHAQAATNRRFLSLYDGTNWRGESNHGWNLLADHPDGATVCWTCHVPDLSFGDPAADDVRKADGVSRKGVHCDLCHKIQDVLLDQVGLTHGRFGLSLLRPSEGQLFFGPLDDVDRGEDTFSPIQQESRYCASCHEGVLFGVHVYRTYSEWLESPAGKEGYTCQSCHMKPTGAMTNFAPQAGGVERNPTTLASHSLFPGGKEAMLRKCLQLDTSLVRLDNDVRCDITLEARDVGHFVPTGFIDRHLILVLVPRDGHNQPLAQPPAQTPVARYQPESLRLPSEAGPQLAGRPGRLFARMLQDEHGMTPTPFWSATEELPDSRLKPNSPVLSSFHLPRKTNSVRIRLLYRRSWHQVATAKSWPDETIVVFDKTVRAPAERAHGAVGRP